MSCDCVFLAKFLTVMKGKPEELPSVYLFNNSLQNGGDDARYLFAFCSDGNGGDVGGEGDGDALCGAWGENPHPWIENRLQ